MLSNSLLLTLSSLLPTFAFPLSPQPRTNCPPIHIFGARETSVSPGYGSAGTVVNAILGAHSGATAEAIVYPACGGQSSCGGVSYSSSATQGTAAVVSQVGAFAKQCPGAEIVLVGYSQGAEIFDNALCGGGDPNQGIASTGSIAAYNIKAVIFMGDPRFEVGAPYNVGTCKAGGFDARPSVQTCGSFNSKIKSYCDAADPYCCNGNNAATHQGYGSEYGSQALAFVNSLL